MKTGLTLGKFAPLHKGHQLLIEKAMSETDHLIVIVYDSPEVTSIPLPVRSGWIKKLYPEVEVIESWDGPTTVSDEPDITKMHDEYLIKFLDNRKITHFFSNEFYGSHVSKALEAEDCRFDENRSIIQVSGTDIRNDPYGNRQYIHPEVYKDLITKAVFLGAPSTGKTSLAEALANKFSTRWMPEFGREYWESNQVERRLSLDQLVEIAEGHIQREDNLVLESNRFLFADTDATTTFMFSLYYHGMAHPILSKLADNAINRYDIFFLCSDDIPYDNTWDRSGDANRKLFQKQIQVDLIRRRTPFITLEGRLDERIKTVSNILYHFDKFDSIGNNLKKEGKNNYENNKLL
jgi:HTH-type transcriptional regulator, transcriptional repressor of NAD biosynthesis genes